MFLKTLVERTPAGIAPSAAMRRDLLLLHRMLLLQLLGCHLPQDPF
jgi:hypothetical protein